MKTRHELITTPPDQSFKCFGRTTRAFEFQWHHHVEYELTLILSGRGLRFAGDSVVDYSAPDLVLLGPNLPHTWRTHASSLKNRALVLQFRKDFLGADFFARPELLEAARLLDNAGRGLAFPKAVCEAVQPHLEALLATSSGLVKLGELLFCLELMASAKSGVSLASPAYRSKQRAADDERISRACDFMEKHLSEPLALDQVARHVHMSPASFSRFFKRTTGMPCMRYLHQLRIGDACRLLMESDLRIVDICQEVGFRNLSNFNRRFLEIRGLSPRAFRQTFTKPACPAPSIAEARS